MNTVNTAVNVELRAFLTELASKGVRLHAADGVLRCEAPRGTLCAKSRAELSSRKQEILAFLQEAERQAADESLLTQLEPTAPGVPVPLSFAQQRLWVQTQLDDESSAYNMRIALRVCGELDVGALEHAVAELVSRHAVLRTSFAVHDDQPVQVLAEAVDAPVVKIDLREAGEPQQELEALMAQATQTPFDLSRAPLLRVVLVRLDAREHVLLVTLSHLVGDGTSLTILAAEIGELYAAQVEQRVANLPELALQYADFSRWQRQTLDDERLTQLRAHWVEKLRGAPPLLELPTDRARSASTDRRGEEETFLLDPALSDELRALARAHGTTLFMTMLTGFAVLMARYSNQEDLVIGCPISQRSHPELEPLIGMFVNSLAMRIRVDGNPTFQELLERVREVATDAYANQELPLDQLVEALQPERVSTHHPVFQVMFIHDNAPVKIPDFGGLRFEILEHRSFDAKFDLMLSMTELPEGIRGKWEYRRDLFDSQTIRRATQHLRIVLEAMALEPRQRVMQAPLLTGAERQRSLDVWSKGPSVPVDPRSVLECFREQVERNGAGEALRWGGESWTYARLDQRVEQLAHQLRESGVRPGQAVAVMLPRSPDMLASLLAVHAVGGAYVPLDPRYPSGRLSFMIEDADVVAAVTTKGLAAALPALPEAIVLTDVDGVSDPGARVELRCSPDDAAYLMYTSGSTGTPKAVVVTHRGLSNYLSWAARAYGISQGTRAAVSTSVAFDATITTMFGPLIAGGTVILLPEEGETEALAQLMQSDEGVELLKLTPAHIDALRALTAGGVRRGRVRTIVVGGEQLLGEQVAWCQTVAPQARVINEYGPTETVVGCCVHEIGAGATPPKLVAIGRPIANTELYVLNAWLEPMPVGVPGELYIGGAGVARGYHGRPELTSARFVDNPYCIDTAARLYRTGDRVMWQADGSLRFLGRVDAQVKVRGFRIELGEIDAALARHPGVRQSVVVVRAGAGDRQQLVAYVVTGAPSPSVDELREHLADWLPEHMIPSAIVLMSELPLTPNGKIDRAALPDPEAVAAESDDEQRAMTELEQQLAELWAGVLGREQVGVDDNFFHLGGDSILGIQLVARAREQGIQFAPRHLFENQTIAQLGRVVTCDRPAATLSEAASAGPQPLTPIQAWFFEQQLPAEHHFNQSIIVETPVDCDLRALGRALQAVVDHHDALRSRFERVAGEVRVTVAPREFLGLMQVDLSQLDAHERSEALASVAAQAQTKLDLVSGPVFAPTFVWMGPGESPRLVLSAHHLVADGVSWRIIVEDLIRAYAATNAGRDIALPGKTSSYGEWAQQLVTWAASDRLAEQAAFWIGDSERPSAQLRLDHPYTDDAQLVAHTQQLRRTLDAEQTEALQLRVASVYNADVQDALVTALLSSLAESGEAGLLRVDLESHGREDLFSGVDVSRTVGWFTSLYPLAFELEQLDDHARMLMVVKDTLRAVPNRGIGYGVMRYLGPDEPLRARLAEVPGAAVSFNYFGRLDAAPPEVDGFALAREACEPQRSPLGRRRYALEVNAAIRGGELELTWGYSSRLFERETVEAIAARFVDALGDLAATGETATTTRYTPSDFPDVQLSQDDLDQLLADIDITS